MTINYTTLLGLAQPVTGTEAGTWGTVVNDEITALVEQAIAGGTSINVTAGDVTLTTTTGASNQARNAVLLVTGTPGTSRNIIAPSTSKVYIVKNSSDGAVVLKGSATTGVTIGVGVEALCFWNGSDFEIVSMIGPSSSTDTAIAKFNGTTGKVLQNSGVTIDGSNNVSGITQLNATTLKSTNLQTTNVKANDGTAAASIADSTGVISITANPILSGGTANGVLYLNGSKSATSGSALTFDGTNFATTGTVSGTKLIPTGGAVTGNGMYLPAANAVAITTNGTSAIYIDSSQNVGIGTSSPTAKLTVSGNQSFPEKTAAYIGVDLATTAGNGGDFTVKSGNGSGAGNTSGVLYLAYGRGASTASDGYIAFGRAKPTNASGLDTAGEMMRLDSSGNLGLGVTPSAWNSSWKALQIGSLSAFVNNASGNTTDVWHNSYVDSVGDPKYLTTAAASFYRLEGGSFKWFNAASGTAGNAIYFTQAMTLDASGNLGIGTTSNLGKLTASGSSGNYTSLLSGTDFVLQTSGGASDAALIIASSGTVKSYFYGNSSGAIAVGATTTIDFQTGSPVTSAVTRMRIDSNGNVGIGTSSPTSKLRVEGVIQVSGSGNPSSGAGWEIGYGAVTAGRTSLQSYNRTGSAWLGADYNSLDHYFYTSGTESARITSDGGFAMIKTDPNSLSAVGFSVDTSSGTLNGVGIVKNSSSWGTALWINRLAAVGDGTLVEFATSSTSQGSISVSGATVSYNAFSGSHWSQLQEGRGYNPDIPRGTVMSTIGEMCEWKSVVWDDVIEHEATEDKDAWTETIPHRESYLGQLPVGATFEEDGFTKTIVDDGNERLPKVKISDVIGDKSVYGVFQTWDEVQDMLVTSLGAFVVRIAAGVTVQIGDLLESNGDGCAKVQDDDVIRSKTIAKVISTTPTATYADGSYTVPAVIYCG